MLTTLEVWVLQLIGHRLEIVAPLLGVPAAGHVRLRLAAVAIGFLDHHGNVCRYSRFHGAAAATSEDRLLLALSIRSLRWTIQHDLV